jgi:Phosphotransferase enzyme family
VRTPPADISNERVRSALLEGWGLDTAALDYAPLGAGSYHWLARDADGTRAFVTVDDLDSKTWLGDAREPSFAGLRQAFATASTLREHGLAFVVAPRRSLDGEPLARLDERYTIAVFPFVAGDSGTWGPHDPEALPAVVRALAALHAATPAVHEVARTAGLELPGREHLERALAELDAPWHGGPLSEAARARVTAGAQELAALLDRADELGSSLHGAAAITHGEPHVGNVLKTEAGIALVDWDTVALAPPERDLWLVTDTVGVATDLYTELTGTPVDQRALDYFRLTWELKDWAEYLNLLRAPHQETEDTVRACTSLTRIGEVHAEWID